jgi:hypothetical protein
MSFKSGWGDPQSCQVNVNHQSAIIAQTSQIYLRYIVMYLITSKKYLRTLVTKGACNSTGVELFRALLGEAIVTDRRKVGGKFYQGRWSSVKDMGKNDLPL